MKTNGRLLVEVCGLLIVSLSLAYLGRPYSPSGSEPDIEVSGEELTDAELTIFQPEQSYHGLTLYPATGTEKVFLLNMKGEAVHHWNVDATRARLLENCHLLVVHGSKWGLRVEPWKSLRPVVREYDWNGEIVWEYTAPDIIHHDVTRLPNGGTLFPVRAIVPAAYKNKIRDSARKNREIRSDSIYEINSTGNLVWQWDAHDHLDLNSCGKRGCKETPGESNAEDRLADWTHINTVSVIPENRWFDEGDARFKPGNLIVLPRNWWTVFIVDRESKEIVWKYTGDYKGGLSGGHEAHIIEKGLPGAGNMLIFDNGRILHKDESYLLEINPTTKKPVWVYDAGKDFFSRSAGSAQRLPNGNTFISEDVAGRLFEVTPQKEIIWEYRAKYRSSRAKRYDYNYCSNLERFKPSEANRLS